jgi:serine/threonine protein phosphatase PrpC
MRRAVLFMFLLPLIVFVLLKGGKEQPGVWQRPRWAVAARQGDRPSMEDGSVAVNSSDGTSFFGIFDGHGGPRVSDIASNCFYPLFTRWYSRQEGAPIEGILKDTFLSFDQALLKKNISGGSTAAVVFLKDMHAYCAWAGDTRIVIGRNDTVLYATKDHKPDAPNEADRIKHAGGTVYHHGVARLNGVAVSRALGDHKIKKMTPGALIAQPDIAIVPVQPNDTIIIACDGVWDVIDNQQAVAKVHAVLTQKEQVMEDHTVYTRLGKLDNAYAQYPKEAPSARVCNAAIALRDYAYEKGSTDNISVLIAQV